MTNETFLGDCLIENENIKNGSADLILTDLPFGTVQNIGNSETVTHGMQGKTATSTTVKCNYKLRTLFKKRLSIGIAAVMSSISRMITV